MNMTCNVLEAWLLASRVLSSATMYDFLDGVLVWFLNIVLISTVEVIVVRGTSKKVRCCVKRFFCVSDTVREEHSLKLVAFEKGRQGQQIELGLSSFLVHMRKV